MVTQNSIHALRNDAAVAARQFSWLAECGSGRESVGLRNAGKLGADGAACWLAPQLAARTVYQRCVAEFAAQQQAVRDELAQQGRELDTLRSRTPPLLGSKEYESFVARVQSVERRRDELLNLLELQARFVAEHDFDTDIIGRAEAGEKLVVAKIDELRRYESTRWNGGPRR